MNRPRLTIAQVILIVAVLSFVFAAIHSASAAWAGAMSSITFFTMICSLLGVAFERGMRRVYWIGFATLGWSYLLLIYAPWLESRIGRFLLAPNFFAYLAELLNPVPENSGGGLQSVGVELLSTAAVGGGFGAMPPAHIAEYRRIGSSLEALLWAFAGGWVACYFASRRERNDDPHAAQQFERPHAEGPGNSPPVD